MITTSLVCLVLALLSTFSASARDLAAIKIAAEGGDPGAQEHLGDVFAGGAEAELWYRRAAEQGHPSAQAKLADLLLRRATGFSSLDAQKRLGAGQEAFRWATMAATAGDHAAQATLAGIYLAGIYGPKDLVQAYKWGTLGCQGMSIDGMVSRVHARHALDAAILKMTSKEIREGQRLAAEFRPCARQKSQPHWVSMIKLQGISGLQGKRLAIINGKTFGEKESGTVKVSGETVLIQVVALTQDSVTILGGTFSQPITLKMK